MSRKLNVKPDENDPVPVEILTSAIRDTAEGMRRLRRGALNDRAIILLVSHSIPSERRPTLKQIEDVLDGVEGLERNYLKKKV